MSAEARAAIAAELRDPAVPVRGVTVRQPWASHLSYSGKDRENRPRRTSHRGLILVHAGLRTDVDAMHQAPPELPHLDARGEVLAVTRLVGLHHDDDCGGRCSRWAHRGCWHWEITDTHALATPVKARGALYLWDPDASLRARIAAELDTHVDRELTIA